ncbi:hypothetical protein PHYBLDRAFT_68859 [Phycomyces blakesleeanus NRRL 1555(-)]|uniref:Uncharacterized protein n=1 Tax=Phycomyces blakesleeanus (strain ATCC 8743b / DSM 1359 / FGSC 10004 / NBRC 33097 / NRRL 1555) TaxID=763407 RepID=A0A162ZQ15_PHYB8|nr:hypothetical protein PHYBLDRAFT_68859 [Phycomyces blakesleeanus NRRL 1555(-)]OAD68311.1 hypothetical protein PHYBLDRAFT_68859 [Phycomyces blakesleeanus NRRL 1555(-)]|eukprot:XP_018286351.1 hypothetical protein PHYBLDRAFT_68859 [Phycomyces blakesleeanus NRRL 1555(-)]
MLRPSNPDLHLRHLEHEIKYNETITFLATWAHIDAHYTFCKEMGHKKEACIKRLKETRTCFCCSKTTHGPGAIPDILLANYSDFLIEAVASTGMDDHIQLVKTSDDKLGNEETKKSNDEEYYSDNDIDEVAKCFAQIKDDSMNGKNDGGQDPSNLALTL